jgi:hypothetical protein
VAKPAVFGVLRRLGCGVTEDGAIQFSDAFLVDGLRHSFGVFTYDGSTAKYYLLPIAESHNHGRDDPAFFQDIQRARRAVEKGEGVAIVIASILNGDAYTHLTYIPS